MELTGKRVRWKSISCEPYFAAEPGLVSRGLDQEPVPVRNQGSVVLNSLMHRPQRITIVLDGESGYLPVNDV